MFVVDTNILVYAADEDAPEHKKCNELLAQWREHSSSWFLTWGICYEFLRVTTHRHVLRKPCSAGEAWAILEAFFASPGLELLIPTDRHAAVAAEVLQQVPSLAGNVIHDFHTAVLMREHGIKVIYTRDVDFHRFPFLEPIDPLQRQG